MNLIRQSVWRRKIRRHNRRRVWVLMQFGESEAAVTHLRAALRIRPDLVEAQLTLASVLAQQGRSRKVWRKARAATRNATANAEVLGRWHGLSAIPIRERHQLRCSVRWSLRALRQQ